MKTAIVILNWNTRGYLERFLPAVLASVPRNGEGKEEAAPDTGNMEGNRAAAGGETARNAPSGCHTAVPRSDVEAAPDTGNMEENRAAAGGETARNAPAGCHTAVPRSGEAEVIVADNASTDGSMELMAERFPEVRTLRFDRNYGFTGGYNRAFALLREEDFQYYVLLNTDIQVPETWIEPLVSWMDAHPECGACAPKLHSWHAPDRFEYAGAAGGFIDRYGFPFCRGRILNRVEKDDGQYDRIRDVFWATGACLMVRSRLFHELGGLDDRFFAHMEEIDLCWRMQLAGYRITVLPEVTVLHLGGGTLPSSSPLKVKLNYRNNLLMLENNLARTLALTLPAAKALKRAERRIAGRMCIDGLAALAYLLLCRPACFRAVLAAHREFRKLRRKPSAAALEARAAARQGEIRIRGYYDGCLLPGAFFHGKHLYEFVHQL